MKTSSLTSKRLKELLDYDPVTGVFLWREPRGHMREGSRAGSRTRQDGYVYIKIDCVLYRASRLAWLHVHGKWPSGHIDHKNRNTSDDRMANLRNASRSQNHANRKCPKSSTTMYKGVSKRGNRYRAYINKGGQRHWLGNFDEPAEAHQAYITAARNLFGEFARSA